MDASMTTPPAFMAGLWQPAQYVSRSVLARAASLAGAACPPRAPWPDRAAVARTAAATTKLMARVMARRQDDNAERTVRPQGYAVGPNRHGRSPDRRGTAPANSLRPSGADGGSRSEERRVGEEPGGW